MFVIYGNVQFLPGKYEAWQAAYDKLAEYVTDKEHNSTLTYYFGVPYEYKDDFSASPSMLAFEVYNNREDLYTTHFNSAPMGDFLKTVPPLMSTGLDLTHYSVSSGFLDKSGTCAEAALIYDTRITCTSSGARASLLAKLKAVAEAEERDAEGTMSFFVLESLDDETGVRVMERYASKEALDAHLKSERMREFWLGTKEEIKSLEARWYVPNGKGWLHH